jgi:ABC-type transport system involved in cytochrome c biogenesis permease subunit
VELSHGLLPVHIVITILGELLLFFSFAGSVLYLVMEWQLRKKSSMKFIYRLPTLESIENFNRWAVSRSFVLLSLGLVTGMFLAFAAFNSPWLGSPKEIILYCAWLVLFMLFYLRHSRRIPTHRLSQVNAAVFVLLMFVFIFSNIYITKGFHGFK